MVNATIEKFGYPASLVREYRHWLILVRPAQVTAGSLVLAANSDATAFGALDPTAFTELAHVIADTEAMLRTTVNYEKVNYLMLMMVDPHVHFHIFPRYQGDRFLAGMVFQDSGWPGPPDLKTAMELDADAVRATAAVLRSPGVHPNQN
jgi:diadenosine tetraphosphate (Ap4A) HIT family hydrolase